MGAGDHNPRPLLYFDTNLLSMIARGELPDILRMSFDHGAQPVLSEGHLQELAQSSQGQTAEEKAYLASSCHLWLAAGEIEQAREQINLYSVPPSPQEQPLLQRFLQTSLRMALGAQSLEDPNQIFTDLFQSLFEEIVTDLAEKDPQAAQVLAIACSFELEKLRRLDGLRPILPERPSMDAMGFGPRRLNDLRPPKILEQIFDRFDGNARQGIFAELGPELQSPFRIKRVRAILSLLMALGYQPDKSIGKPSVEQSKRGARSQIFDIHHIALASYTSGFFTSDARAAKLAYAAYEYLGLDVAVIYCKPPPSPFEPKRLGPSTWPE